MLFLEGPKYFGKNVKHQKSMLDFVDEYLE